jgi:hypothetical protein
MGLGGGIFSQLFFQLQKVVGLANMFFVCAGVFLLSGIFMWGATMRPQTLAPEVKSESLGAALVAQAQPKTLTRLELLHMPQFWLLWVMVFCTLVPGWCLLAVASELLVCLHGNQSGTHLSSEDASGWVGILTVAYTVARATFGLLTDKAQSPRFMFLINYTVQLLALIGIPLVNANFYRSFDLVFVLLWLLMFMFGGSKVIIGTTIATYLGAHNLAAGLGLILTAIALCYAVALPIASLHVTKCVNGSGKSSFNYAFHALTGFAAVGLVCAFFLKKVPIKYENEEEAERRRSTQSVSQSSRKLSYISPDVSGPESAPDEDINSIFQSNFVMPTDANYEATSVTGDGFGSGSSVITHPN